MNIEKENRPFLVEDIDHLLEHWSETAVVDMVCPICKRYIRIPLIARQRDVKKFNDLINIVKRFMIKHPEIKQELLKELIDDLLQAL